MSRDAKMILLALGLVAFANRMTSGCAVFIASRDGIVIVGRDDERNASSSLIRHELSRESSCACSCSECAGCGPTRMDCPTGPRETRCGVRPP